MHDSPEDRHLVDFVDTAAIGLHRVAADGTILWANASDYEPLGYTREEYVGHNITEFHADDDVINDILARLSRGEKLHEYEARLRCSDGSIRQVRITSSVLFGEGGEFLHTRCFTRDVTNAKKTEEALRQALKDREHALAHAEDAIRARDVFLAVAAHELRTPLTPLRLQVERLLRQLHRGELGDKLIEHAAEGLGMAQRQVQRLERLVNNLLDVSRLASGQVDLQPEALELVAVTRDVVERHSAQTRESGATISIAAHAPLPAHLDRSRVEQVLENLLSNALKYGNQKPIEITFGESGQHGVITVRDRGPGIPLEDQKRIFLRFERAASARHYAGLGLGLWITSQLVEVLGGEIAVESVPGDGATFSVKLPVTRG